MIESAPVLALLLGALVVLVVLQAFARALWDEHFWSSRRECLKALGRLK